MFLTMLVFPSAPARGAPIDCSRGTNTGFEAPLVRTDPMGPAPNWALFDETDVPGWDTSATDNQIEFWESTFLGVPSFSGGQHAELNATQASTLSQDFPTLEGDSIDWQVAHRARTAPTDSADVLIGTTASPTLQQVMVSPTGSWTTYSGTYVVPPGQTTTRLAFESNDTGSLGNFLDGIVLELECNISVTSSFVGFVDLDSSGHTNPGDTAGFGYTVSNDGSATLEGIALSDTLGGGITCADSILTPGTSTSCSGSFALTSTQVDGGIVTSDVTASGTDAAGVTVSAGDTDSAPIIAVPALTLSKSGIVDDSVVAPSGQVDPGDVVNYSLLVTNTGNVTLDPVMVDDPTAGTVSCPAAALGEGESMTCTTSVVLSQGQIDDGSLSNTATANGTHSGTVVADVDSTTVVIDSTPDLLLEKQVEELAPLPDGQVRVSFRLEVENAGNVTLDDLALNDDVAGLFASFAPHGFVATSGTLQASMNWDGSGSSNILAPGQALAPGQTGDVLVGFTITASSDGVVTNGATLTGSAPDSSVVSAGDTAEVGIEGRYRLEVSKSGVADSDESAITWIVLVRNVGPAVANDGITVTDTPGDGLVLISASGPGWECSVSPSVANCTHVDPLAVGETSVITITSEPGSGSGSFTNSASVLGGNGQFGEDTTVAAVVIGQLPLTGLDLDRGMLLAVLAITLGAILLKLSRVRRSSSLA